MVFWTALFGAPGQISAALLPACMASFWQSVLRCSGAETWLASTFWLATGMEPRLCDCQSQAVIRGLGAPLFVRVFRYSRMVVSSGLCPPSSNPARRNRDRRSRTTNAIRTSERL